jgi:predicted  nucleic acid-binding Zn-ribbon protein
MAHPIPEGEAPELLERLLEQDDTIEDLERQIRATKERLKDLRDSLKDAMEERSKLSRSCRDPEPLPLLQGGRA